MSTSDAVLPAKPSVYRSIEGLIQHFEVLMPNRGFEVPHEEVYAATESPNGELGFYIVGDGTTRAYRCRTRPPSFIHFSLFPHMIRGPPAQRRGGRARQHEHHRGGAGSVSGELTAKDAKEREKVFYRTSKTEITTS